MKNEKFITPEIEVVDFTPSDVIATSGNLDQPGDFLLEEDW